MAMGMEQASHLHPGQLNKHELHNK